jgi:hypothetical protein
MTSNNTLKRRVSMAGVMLVTAGATVTGLLGAAAPASATDYPFVAIAVGLLNDAPPVQTVGGLSIDPDQNKASQGALTDCVNSGGGHCVVEIIANGECAAAASNDFGEIVAAQYTTLRVAREHAVDKLQNKQGAHVVQSGCWNGQGRLPIPPPPSAPPPPKLGPTASFHPILGGLEADITDRSGVASQCTYVMDNVNRSFGLAANSTFELKIVPLIPNFRDRSVTITCDNGTKTQATAHF